MNTTKSKSDIAVYKLNYDGKGAEISHNTYQARILFNSVLPFIQKNKDKINVNAEAVYINIFKLLPNDRDYKIEEVLKVMRSTDAAVDAYLEDTTGVIVKNIDATDILQAMLNISATSAQITIRQDTDSIVCMWCNNISHKPNYSATLYK